MTNKELRGKLKHVAAILLGIACDLGADEDKIADLTAEVERLKAELAYKKQPKTPEQIEAQREKQRQRMREYWARKKAAKAAANQAPALRETDGNGLNAPGTSS